MEVTGSEAACLSFAFSMKLPSTFVCWLEGGGGWPRASQAAEWSRGTKETVELRVNLPPLFGVLEAGQ